MNDPNLQNDEAEIRTLIEHWAKAVREQTARRFVQIMTPAF
jgi:hypothetical protein